MEGAGVGRRSQNSALESESSSEELAIRQQPAHGLETARLDGWPVNAWVLLGGWCRAAMVPGLEANALLARAGKHRGAGLTALDVCSSKRSTSTGKTLVDCDANYQHIDAYPPSRDPYTCCHVAHDSRALSVTVLGMFLEIDRVALGVRHSQLIRAVRTDHPGLCHPSFSPTPADAGSEIAGWTAAWIWRRPPLTIEPHRDGRPRRFGGIGTTGHTTASRRSASA